MALARLSWRPVLLGTLTPRILGIDLQRPVQLDPITIAQ
jgi:hypothetical protein